MRDIVVIFVYGGIKRTAAHMALIIGTYVVLTY
jgi:hypothetical protein